MKWGRLPCLIVLLAAESILASEVDYYRDIKPLLARKCSACHGPMRQQAGLRLDSGQLILRGSARRMVVVPGKAAASLLVGKITAEDPDQRMPPEGDGSPLTSREIAFVTQWIDAGAAVPADEVVPRDPQLHWAYQIPQRPRPPDVTDSRWSHPIDRFIHRQHDRMGLEAVVLADRYTLLRRVSIDLIGLPPSPKQLQSFVNDHSESAWFKVVDSLLENRHYGERWGRHWMDVWRYSDWDGYKQELRGSQRHIWRWRDWIVQSLNADKGYHRMIVEMLAADEIAPCSSEILAATGFLARNYHKSNRNIWLDATVEHTAKAFLGMTLNCARCHDHKYDPIQQSAYYQFRAIFEPHNVRTDRVPGQPDLKKDGLPRAYDADLEAETYLYVQGNEKQPDKNNPITPAVPAVLGGTFDIRTVELPAEAYYPSLIDFIEKEEIARAKSQLADARGALQDATEPSSGPPDSNGSDPHRVRRLDLELTVAQLRLKSVVARFAADRHKFSSDDSAEDVHYGKMLARRAAAAERELNCRRAELIATEKRLALDKVLGKNRQEDDKAAIGRARKELAEARKELKTAQEALKRTDSDYTATGKLYPRTSSGRRLALARWITSQQNPLTARVAVNHIWMRHFGAPLVDNVFDFGLRTAKPRHADLLDWLAVELMENDWSMKHLHRLIVTSRTWRLASSSDESDTSGNRAVDSDNHYLWRMNVRRLDAEIVRDQLLAVSGQLDTTLGGPEIDHRQGEVSRRRSIYLRHAYEKQMPMLVLFDAASPNECYRRSVSIIPQQALALMNSSLSLKHSRLLASQLGQESAADDPSGAHFIRRAFLHVLSRPPTDDELSACRQFLMEQAATLSDRSNLAPRAGGGEPAIKAADDPRQRARENLIHVLFNHNDFVTIR